MVASSRSFPCTQCGGTASPVPGREYLQCDYCQSLVFSSDNPLTVDRISPVDGDMQADCPSCRQQLSTGKIEERPVLYCSGCYGFLLKNEHFGAIVRQRRARRQGCESESPQPLDPAQYERLLNCPACQNLMEVHPYYGPGNVVIDSCHQCQYIWLDHGELRTVERVQGGKEPEVLPMFINEHGDITIIPPPDLTQKKRSEPAEISLADIISGLW